MQITITFDSWGELEAFRNPPVLTLQEQATEQIKEILTAAPAPEPEPEPEPDVETKPVDRAEVRKVLAALNKREGKNRAAELIAAEGFKKLTDVPDEALGRILQKAEELLNG